MKYVARYQGGRFDMRLWMILLAPIILAPATLSQTGEQAGPPEVLILKHEWSKERIAWETDPLSTPNETYAAMKDRVRNERRPRTALEERSIKDATEEQKKPSKPPRYVFRYLLTVHNSSLKPIKELDWDYLFSDEKTGELLGRREFTSVEKIGPGKKKQLSIVASTPPTQTISVHSLGSNERAGLFEKVVILRVLFEDGTVWTAGDPKFDE